MSTDSQRCIPSFWHAVGRASSHDTPGERGRSPYPRAVADFRAGVRWCAVHTTTTLWFWMLARVCALSDQDTAAQRRVKVPKSDTTRRQQELDRYVSHLRLLNVALPPCDPQQDYIWAGFYLSQDTITTDHLPSSMFPMGSLCASEIEGCFDGKPSQIAGKQFRIGDHTIGVATACPPGRLRSGVAVGFFPA